MNFTVSRPGLLACFLVLGFGVASTMAGDWSPWVGGFFGILLSVLLLLSREKITFGRSWRSPWRWALLLLVVLAISVPLAGDRYAGIRTWMYWLVGLTFFLSARALDRRYRRQVLQWLVWLGGVGSVWAIVQFIRFGTIDRAGGFLENANAFGGYAILLLPLALGLSRGVRGWRRWALLGAAACLALALVLSYSVTGVAALGVVGVVAFFMSAPVVRRRWVGVTLGALLVLAVSGVGIRFAQTHTLAEAIRLDKVITATHFQTSFSQRWQFDTVALAMVRRHPLAGVGLGSYQQTFTQYATSRLEQPRYTHNAYLEVAAEAGLVSFGVLTVFLWFLGRAIVRAYRTSEVDRNILGGAALGLLASAAHALVDFSWHFPAVWVGFWIIVGLTVVRTPDVRGTAAYRILGIAFGVLSVAVLARGVGIALSYIPFQRADRQVEEGNLVDAIGNFQAGLRWDPDPTRMTKLAAVLWLERPEKAQSLADATTWAERALQWSRINFATYQALARLAVATQDEVRAGQMYKRMVDMDRHFHPDVTAEYVNFLRTHGQPEIAQQLVAEAEQAYVGILAPGQSLFGAQTTAQ